MTLDTDNALYKTNIAVLKITVVFYELSRIS